MESDLLSTTLLSMAPVRCKILEIVEGNKLDTIHDGATDPAIFKDSEVWAR